MIAVRQEVRNHTSPHCTVKVLNINLATSTQQDSCFLDFKIHHKHKAVTLNAFAEINQPKVIAEL